MNMYKNYYEDQMRKYRNVLRPGVREIIGAAHLISNGAALDGIIPKFSDYNHPLVLVVNLIIMAGMRAYDIGYPGHEAFLSIPNVAELLNELHRLTNRMQYSFGPDITHVMSRSYIEPRLASYRLASESDRYRMVNELRTIIYYGEKTCFKVGVNEYSDDARCTIM
jgi:hypothetical protein